MLRSSCKRSGVTLLELLLVVSIMVAMTALAFPTVQSFYRSIRVDAGADAIRTAMVQARLHAIEHGRPYRVAILPGERNIRVAPEMPEFWDGSENQQFSSTTDVQPYISAEEGPDNVRYFLMDSNSRAAPVSYDEPLLSSEVSPDQWVTLAVFFPDGTAHKDVRLLVHYQGTLSRVLTLRGLTGAVTRRDATPEEESQFIPGME